MASGPHHWVLYLGVWSSWTLSFSLLARIILVSAARIPPETTPAGGQGGGAIGQLDVFSEDTVQTEEVRINQDSIQTLISDSQPQCTRLPPPDPRDEPDHTPTGLFTSDSDKKPLPLRRSQTLNKHVQQHVTQRQQTIKNFQEKEKANAARSARVARQSVVLMENGGGTAGMGAEQRKASDFFSSVRTMSICTNFRNAQKLLLELQRNADKSGHQSLSDDSSDEEFSDDEEDNGDNENIPGNNEEDEDRERVRFKERASSFEHEDIGGNVNLRLMQQIRRQSEQQHNHFFRSQTEAGVDPRTGQYCTFLRQQSTCGPATDENFILYADMMNEAESIELLSNKQDISSDKVRNAVLGSLSSKQDVRREQRKWKETKADEVNVYHKNLEKHKDCIDEVVRMVRLKGECSSPLKEKSQQDVSSRMWNLHMEERKKSINKIDPSQSRILSSVEVKMLSRLRLYETPEDVSARRLPNPKCK